MGAKKAGLGGTPRWAEVAEEAEELVFPSGKVVNWVVLKRESIFAFASRAAAEPRCG